VREQHDHAEGAQVHEGCGFRVDPHPMVGILTAKGCRKQRRAMWRVGKVDPAPETRRPDRFPGPPPVSRPSPGKRKCLSQNSGFAWQSS
jgi:hypothetical protein